MSSVARHASIRVRANIRPELIEFRFVEHPAPWRHLAFAIKDELVEARPFLGGELAQIEAGAGSLELLAMASHAMFLVELRARLDLILRPRGCPDSRQRTCDEAGADCDCLVHDGFPPVARGGARLGARVSLPVVFALGLDFNSSLACSPMGAQGQKR